MKFYSGWSHAGPVPVPTNYGLSVYLHDAFDPSHLAAPLTVCRLAHKGNPDPEQMHTDALPAIARGHLIQYANERNNSVEAYTKGPQQHLSEQRAFAERVGKERVVSMPPSPDSPAPLEWFPLPDDCGIVGAHCYGDYNNMIRHLDMALSRSAGRPVLVTECNAGWGNRFNLDVWARAEFTRFLAYCHQNPQVLGVGYFAPLWATPDTIGASSINGLATAVEGPLGAFAVLAKPQAPQPPQNPPEAPQKPPHERGGPVEYITKLTAYKGSREGHSIEGAVIHTAEGSGTWEQAYNYLLNHPAKLSTHRLVGPDKIAIFVPDQLAAWHAGSDTSRFKGYRGNDVNLVTIGWEMLNRQGARPAEATISNTIADVAASAERHNYPTSGVVGHREVDGTRRKDPSGVDMGAFRAAVEALRLNVGSVRDYAKGAWYLEFAITEARKRGDDLAARTIESDLLPLSYYFRDK
jgi:hypothetical protein